MTESRKQKSRKQARVKIARLTRKDQVAALELSILVVYKNQTITDENCIKLENNWI